MALWFTADIVAKILIQELEKDIDMLSGGGSVFWAMGRWLAVPVVGKLLPMMIQNPVRGSDLDGLAVEADVRVVYHNGLESVDKMFRMNDHKGAGHFRAGRLRLWIQNRQAAIVSMIDLLKRSGNRSVVIPWAARRRRMERATGCAPG
jgi:hypothetical protein